MKSAETNVQERGPKFLFEALISRVLAVRWTMALAATMLAANWGLLASSSSWTAQFLKAFEYNRDAILQGQLWRLVTGNLVHWSAEHFWLDVGVFLLLGAAFEPSFKRVRISFGSFVLATSFFVGSAVLFALPDMKLYRGLSGVDSGIFAAALLFEAVQARTRRRRWWYLAPAALAFTMKIVFECWTGELFFSTSSLGDLGQPVPLAHAAGAFAAFPMLLRSILKRADPASGERSFFIAQPPSQGSCSQSQSIGSAPRRKNADGRGPWPAEGEKRESFACSS